MGEAKKIPKWGWFIFVPLIALAFLPVVVPIYIFGSAIVEDLVYRKPFDSEVWKKSGSRSGHDETRLRMVDNLIKSQVLKGKTREEVVGLLGQPGGDPAVKTRFPDWQMHYYMGLTKEFMPGFDYDYLVLRLDEHGRVVAVGIVTLTT